MRWIAAITATALFLLVLLVSAFFLIGRFNLFHTHEHCIKNTGLTLRIYAEEHNGRYPFNTNGFGDAIADFVKDYSPEFVRIFTAPGDDGKWLEQSIAAGKHLPEENCSRAYVQGLCETNNLQIAIVFDRYPTRGGDHQRCPWGPWLREVSLLDGSMRVIEEKNWPEFRKKQIELLVAEGFTRERAEGFYKPMARHN